MGSYRQLDNTQTGKVASINFSDGGVPKKAITVAQVSVSGLVGDAQNDKEGNSGPERTV